MTLSYKPLGFQRIQSGLNESTQQPNQATPEEAAIVERYRLKHARADEYQRGFEAGLAATRKPSEA